MGLSEGKANTGRIILYLEELIERRKTEEKINIIWVNMTSGRNDGYNGYEHFFSLIYL